MNLNPLKYGEATERKLLAEGKTKQIFAIPGDESQVVIRSKDRITAFNAVRQHELEGKASLSNLTNCRVFQYLKTVGIRTHFVEELNETEFVARRCDMVPIEWIARRVATGSYLKRNEGVKEGHRFAPPIVEISFKDDEQGDPFWSEAMLLDAQLSAGGRLIGSKEVVLMTKMTRCIFEVLERAWAAQGCSLIDMKIEFGVTVDSKEILLADVIDSDSWRLWPSGDRRMQLDKQFYRDLPEVTNEHLQQLKSNFAKTAEMLQKFLVPPRARVVCLMGSSADRAHCEKIASACANFDIACHLRVASAHKSTEYTLRVVSEYEGDGVPTVFVCVAGRSNGLGPVVAGNSVCPVINCPPIDASWGSQDIWSSLRLPSGLACSTVLTPEMAALNAASLFALNDHVVWAKLRVQQLNNFLALMDADCNTAAATKQPKSALENGIPA